MEISVTRGDILIRPFSDKEGKFIGYQAGPAHDFPIRHERELPDDLPQDPREALELYVHTCWPEIKAFAIGRGLLVAKPETDHGTIVDAITPVLPGVFQEHAEEIAHQIKSGK